MSRLYDRVMAEGCEPVSERDYLDWLRSLDLERERTRAAVVDLLGREPTDEEFSVAFAARLTDLGASHADPLHTNEFLARLPDAVVVSTEEVAEYCATLSGDAELQDLLVSVAPPFDPIFVESQHLPSRLRQQMSCRSWGVLLSVDRGPDEDGWLVDAMVVGELEKGKPVGPLARWHIPLNPDGTLAEMDAPPIPVDPEGNWYLSEEHFALWLYRADLLGQEREAAFYFSGSMVLLLMPALFALSFMHCKNVDIRPVDPPERLSRKHARKHGRPLTRYYVLDIRPMRRILDTEGEAQTKGLRHALHICRGHFKTFSEDAPLFGTHVGTYWWDAQVRGKAEHGVVEKDYRIRLDQGLGREYVQADEHPEIKRDAPEHAGLDPDLGGRGLRAHNITQNLLAQAVRDAGYEPRRPKPSEPQYDLAWGAGDVTWVAEVKSITSRNEERQLRIALGQVIRYRQLLEDEGREVRAMIATEMKPIDPSWNDLCSREDIALAWGPDNLTVPDG